MSCPTCDHTMQSVHEHKHWQRFWCPRCGTLLEHGLNDPSPSEAPKLVGFLRDFYRMISDNPQGDALRTLARISGITESIFRPEDRK